MTKHLVLVTALVFLHGAPALAQNPLPDCGSDGAVNMVKAALQDNLHLQVLDFEEVKPDPNTINFYMNGRGVELGAALSAERGNTPTEKVCVARIVTNSGQRYFRYHLFFSTKGDTLVEVSEIEWL
jgi:siroheme synthase